MNDKAAMHTVQAIKRTKLPVIPPLEPPIT